MCGRFSLRARLQALAELLELLIEPEQPLFEARYNIAPSQSVLAVRQPDGRELVELKWGLVPSWAKDPKIGYRRLATRKNEKPPHRAHDDSPGN